MDEAVEREGESQDASRRVVRKLPGQAAYQIQAAYPAGFIIAFLAAAGHTPRLSHRHLRACISHPRVAHCVRRGCACPLCIALEERIAVVRGCESRISWHVCRNSSGRHLINNARYVLLWRGSRRPALSELVRLPGAHGRHMGRHAQRHTAARAAVSSFPRWD